MIIKRKHSRYSKAEVLTMCQEAFDTEPSQFYTDDTVNYRGLASDDDAPYAEVVAGFVLENIAVIKDADWTVPRTQSYVVETHDAGYDDKSRCVEENVAKKLCSLAAEDKPYSGFGWFVDYQVPLKKKKSNNFAGKIDLLAFDDEENVLRLVEFKREDSEETMLRCVLEAYTYFRTVDEEKLKSEYQNKIHSKIESVCPTVLVYENGRQHKEMLEASPNLKKLIKELDVDIFLINSSLDTIKHFELS